jgi:hypothetical protein
MGFNPDIRSCHLVFEISSNQSGILGSSTEYSMGDGLTVDGLGLGFKDNNCLLIGFLPLFIKIALKMP